MKRILALFFFVSLFTMVFGQEYSFRYGKISPKELTMTSYPNDTTASAVVIYKTMDASYQYNCGNFTVEYDYAIKTKVLKSDGTSCANITIPFYLSEINGNPKDLVTRIEAIAYNTENGKVIKTKMGKECIFEERINKHWKQIKFSIPAVKVGTVIEYRYKITSERYYQLPDWIIQESNPIIYTNYEVRIPEYFNFSIDTRGAELVKTEEKQITQTFIIPNREGTESVSANARQLNFITHNLSAIKDEPYIWCPDDYKTQINFELKGIQFPYSMYKTYTTTWEKVDETLNDDSDFGGVLKMKNPFKEEMSALNLSNASTYDKIRKIFNLAKSKIIWNNEYGFWGGDTKKAIKIGTGNNAEINFVLISMLKDANINAFPVLISRRNYNKLPYTHPSLDKLNTFIVGINDTDSTTVYIDGSIRDGDINILPTVLMTDRARLFQKKGNEAWTDLSKLGKNTINTVIQGSITPDGIINAQRAIYYFGQAAATYRNKFKAQKDSTTYIENLESENTISIKDYTHKDLNTLSSRVQITYNFTKNTSNGNGYIYLNPIIFPHITNNPFINEKRQLPIEFDFPYTLKLTSILKIPEGYEVEELPKPIKINYEGNKCSLSYIISVSDNNINLSYSFAMNTIFYGKEDYPLLRALWTKIIEKNNEQIVLKKIDKTNNTQQK